MLSLCIPTPTCNLPDLSLTLLIFWQLNVPSSLSEMCPIACVHDFFLIEKEVGILWYISACVFVCVCARCVFNLLCQCTHLPVMHTYIDHSLLPPLMHC